MKEKENMNYMLYVYVENEKESGYVKFLKCYKLYVVFHILIIKRRITGAELSWAQK